MLGKLTTAVLLFAAATASAQQWTGITDVTFPDDLVNEGTVVQALNFGPDNINGAPLTPVTVDGITYTTDTIVYNYGGGLMAFDNFGFNNFLPDVGADYAAQIGATDPDVLIILDTGRTYFQAAWGGPNLDNFRSVPLSTDRVYRTQLLIGLPYDTATGIFFFDSPAFDLFPRPDQQGPSFFQVGIQDNFIPELTLSTLEFQPEIDPALGVAIDQWSLRIPDSFQTANLIAYTLHDITDLCPLEYWRQTSNASLQDLQTEGELVEAFNIGGTESETTVGGITYTLQPFIFTNIGQQGFPAGFSNGDPAADPILGTSVFYENFFGSTPSRTNMTTVTPLIEGNTYRVQLVLGHSSNDWGATFYRDIEFGGPANRIVGPNGSTSVATYEFVAENNPDLGGVREGWSLAVNPFDEIFIEILAYTLHDITGLCDANVCVADFNVDGVVNFFDLLDYLIAFDDGDGSADVDGIAGVDDADLAFFLSILNAGC